MNFKQLPFDLEKALAGAKVATRDGREVTQLAHFTSAEENYVVYAVIDNKIRSFTEQGRFYLEEISREDLFILEETVEPEVDETPEIKVGDKVYVSAPADIYEVIAKYKSSDVYIVESEHGELIKFKASGLKLYKPEPAKLSGFINVYARKNSNAWMHETKERADEDAGEDRIACIDLSQFEVGHGLGEA